MLWLGRSRSGSWLTDLFEKRIWQVWQGRQATAERWTRLALRRQRCSRAARRTLLLLVAFLQELLQQIAQKTAGLSWFNVEIDDAELIQVPIELGISGQLVLVDLQQNFIGVIDTAVREGARKIRWELLWKDA